MPEALPRELICCIMSQVDCRTTLCNLALCSHAFYLCAIRHLYKHVDFNAEGVACGCLHFERIRALGSLLLQRADLARLVRQFTMREGFSHGHDSKRKEERGEEPEVVEVDSVFKQVIKASSCSEEEEREWLKNVSWTDHTDAILALVLPALINLERLDLFLECGIIYFKRIMRSAACRRKPFDTEPAFQNLKEFMHTWFDDENGMSAEYAAMFLRLPAISAVYGYHVGRDDDEEADRTLAALDTGSSTVTYIELKGSYLSIPNITHMLRAPKALQTFICELGGAHISAWATSFKAIHEAFTPQKHCLENLWLDYEHQYRFISDHGLDETAPMPSFAGFEALKFLKIATLFLFGYKGRLEQHNDNEDKSKDWNDSSRRRLAGLFPTMLETLYVPHCEDYFSHLLTALEDLLLQKEEYNPTLIKVVLQGPTAQDMKLLWRIGDLVELAASQNVSLVIEKARIVQGCQYFVEREWGMDIEREWGMEDEGV